MKYKKKVIIELNNGKKVFSNGLLTHLDKINHPRYKNLPVYILDTNKIYFNDGEKISYECINKLIDIYDEIKYEHYWQDNDLLFVDNKRFMHGRTMKTYDTDERIIYSRFGTNYINRSEFTDPFI